jgi:hypothetical protein
MRWTSPTRLRAPLSPLVGIALIALALPAPALGSGVAQQGNKIIRECLLKDSVSGGYSVQDYQYALAHLPTDVTEYSDCQAVIRRAELAAAAGNPTGATGTRAAPTQGGAFRDPFAKASPAERAAILARQSHRPGALRIGAALVRPGLISVRPSSFTHSLPDSLLAALLALGASALAGLGWVLIARVRARRSG